MRNPSRATQAAINRSWRERNPEKYRAHIAVAAAVRKGTLKKGPCEGCGRTDQVHAHHDDYAKPLEVRWLCHWCHRATFGGSCLASRKAELLPEARRLRAEGLTQREIAQRLGVARSTVSFWELG